MTSSCITIAACLCALICACAMPAMNSDAAIDGALDAGVDSAERLAIPRFDEVREDEHVRACVRLGACFPEGGRELSVCASSFVYFLGDLQHAELGRLVRCISSAGTDCDAVRRCTDGGQLPSACNAATYTARCDGNVARTCRASTSLTYSVDCGALGLACVLDRLRRPSCGLGSCAEGGYAATCDATRVIQCVDSVITYADCATAGMRCVVGATHTFPADAAIDGMGAGDTLARCAGRGPICDASRYPPSCDGTLVRACLGGYVAAIDCAAYQPGWRCITRSDGSPACVRTASPACHADPLNGTDFPERCVDDARGAAIEFCLGGVVARFVCSDAGFSRCERGTAGGPPRCAP